MYWYSRVSAPFDARFVSFSQSAAVLCVPSFASASVPGKCTTPERASPVTRHSPARLFTTSPAAHVVATDKANAAILPINFIFSPLYLFVKANH